MYTLLTTNTQREIIKARREPARAAQALAAARRGRQGLSRRGVSISCPAVPASASASKSECIRLAQ